MGYPRLSHISLPQIPKESWLNLVENDTWCNICALGVLVATEVLLPVGFYSGQIDPLYLRASTAHKCLLNEVVESTLVKV